MEAKMKFWDNIKRGMELDRERLMLDDCWDYISGIIGKAAERAQRENLPFSVERTGGVLNIFPGNKGPIVMRGDGTQWRWEEEEYPPASLSDDDRAKVTELIMQYGAKFRHNLEITILLAHEQADAEGLPVYIYARPDLEFERSFVPLGGSFPFPPYFGIMTILPANIKRMVRVDIW
jgi:hypothetical protein